MKTKYNILLSVVFLVGMFSCKNYEEYQDIIYFTGTDESPTLKFTVEEPSSMGISVRASCKVDADVKVNFAVDTTLVKEWNKETGKNYKLLPANSYKLANNSAVIPAGKFASKPVLLSITSIDSFKDEDTYCIPITITSMEGGDYSVLETSRTIYVVVNKTIITKATILNGQYFKVDFAGDPGRDLTSVPQVTMEARIFVNKFQNNDPYISTVMGLEENFLLRFGDVKIDPNYLQLAGGGYPVASTGEVSSDKWVHVAATYDGAKICIYIDGKLNAYTAAPRGRINLTGIDPSRSFYIGRTSADYDRYLNGNISEARVWTRALSQAEIANNICAVSPDSPDLLAYWKFNTYKDEQNKNIVPDLTGHGYNAIGNGDVSFVEGVKCP